MATLAQPRTALGEATLRYLRDLIRLDTSNPPGNEIIAAEYLAGVLRGAGIEPVVIETAPRRGNVIARLCGDGSGAPLLLYAHTDVVPAEREHWSVDPFGGVVRDGYVYGRGALDMKGILAMQLAVFLALAREIADGSLTLRRDLILAATADEESDTNQGIGVLVTRHPDLLRAEYALSEFGGYTLHLDGKRFYPIQTAEKGNVWMRLIAQGQPGHASVPSTRNAVLMLAQALLAFAQHRFRTHITPTAHVYLAKLAEHLNRKQGVALRAWLETEALRSVPLEHIVRDERLAAMLHAMTHVTLTPTGLRAGYKTNVVPSQAEATLDCRTLPGMGAEAVIDELRAVLGVSLGQHVQFVVDSEGEGVEFPFDTPLFRLLERVLRHHDPQAIPVPYMMTGGTDAKHLARLGVICYGFSPLQLAENEHFVELAHAHDERVSIAALEWGVHVLYDVVRAWVSS
ncbi:MAG: M20/M25/M40 family metallo-hydrolase [Thermoflexales bacterium]|nr:M20/M25/M40 family metallo-hydrolase [Thermoflexales bacterium]